MICGAAGLGIAALFYFVALQVLGMLEYLPPIPEAGIVVFLLILGVALLESGAVILVLIRLATLAHSILLFWITAGFVGFAGVYTLAYGLFASDVRGVQVFAGLAVVRWVVVVILPLGRMKDEERKMRTGD